MNEIEPIRLGGIFDNETKHQAGSVWDKDNISPTIDTMQGGYRQPMIIEDFYKNRDPRVYEKNAPTLRAEREGLKVIVASRGRNPDNPSDRKQGIELEQRLEPNSEGICNCLTTVSKDNLVFENLFDVYNNKLRDDECCGTLTTNGNTSFRKCGTFAVIEQSTVKIKQATKEGYIECKVGGVADLLYPTSKTRRGRVQDNGDTCPTLTANEMGVYKIDSPYRIRKLTALECWRLMGFADDDFRKAEKVNSNTQLYKQSGNSIVVNVLEAIFRNLNIQNIKRWEEL